MNSNNINVKHIFRKNKEKAGFFLLKNENKKKGLIQLFQY